MVGKVDMVVGKLDMVVGKEDMVVGKVDMVVSKEDMVVGKVDMVVGKVVNKAKGVERLHQKAGCALMSRIVTGAGLKRRNILKTRSLRLRISYVSADAYSSLVRQQDQHPQTQQQQQHPQALQMQSQLQLQA